MGSFFFFHFLSLDFYFIIIIIYNREPSIIEFLGFFYRDLNFDIVTAPQ